MVGWLKKYYAECPSCGGAQVRVPWEQARVRGRRRLGLGLAALWISMAGWVTLSVMTGSIWPWTSALVASAAISAGALVKVSRDLRRYDCTDCGHRWYGGPGGAPPQ